MSSFHGWPAEPRVSSVARAVKRENLTYLPFERLATLEREARRVLKNVRGDFVEFGLALGGSSIVLAKTCVPSRRFHGFDVFGMIPPPTSPKDDDVARRRYATIASGKSEGIGGETYYGYREDLLGEVVEAFSRYGLTVDNDAIHLYPGLFQKSWPRACIDRIALAHIDSDWYDPVRFCLEAIVDKLSPEGAIVIDDYADYGGCRTATDEFLAAHHSFG
jgi:asparagine synthase (glutamine-hydrolysing)